MFFPQSHFFWTNIVPNHSSVPPLPCVPWIHREHSRTHQPLIFTHQDLTTTPRPLPFSRGLRDEFFHVVLPSIPLFLDEHCSKSSQCPSPSLCPLDPKGTLQDSPTLDLHPPGPHHHPRAVLLLQGMSNTFFPGCSPLIPFFWMSAIPDYPHLSRCPFPSSWIRREHSKTHQPLSFAHQDLTTTPGPLPFSRGLRDEFFQDVPSPVPFFPNERCSKSSWYPSPSLWIRREHSKTHQPLSFTHQDLTTTPGLFPFSRGCRTRVFQGVLPQSHFFWMIPIPNHPSLSHCPFPSSWICREHSKTHQPLTFTHQDLTTTPGPFPFSRGL
ncbi:uncharacterized protein LOC116784457 [Chiroxiphia lanceolata]|uniref:uncharacterized protein LOC116784457 n=1 Tax=Chiroxiphia lanceolata TaxID=296741 RepID=UPI0013CEF6CC|nr:uncharacterized protein LOC116784457 [Chiroxiphia lanceolata]